MEIKFLKTDERAVLPAQNNEHPETGDSGFDIRAVADVYIPPKKAIQVAVGFKVAYITPGFWFRIEARSGLSFKNNVLPHQGIIDNQYRGDLAVLLYNHSDREYFVNEGDKIAQLVLYKLLQPKVSWTDEVDETARGEKGLGESGK